MGPYDVFATQGSLLDSPVEASSSSGEVPVGSLLSVEEDAVHHHLHHQVA